MRGAAKVQKVQKARKVSLPVCCGESVNWRGSMGLMAPLRLPSKARATKHLSNTYGTTARRELLYDATNC